MAQFPVIPWALVLMSVCGCSAPSTAPISVAQVTADRGALGTNASEQHQALVPIALAEALAKRCKVVQVDKRARRETVAGVEMALRAQGYSRSEVARIRKHVETTGDAASTEAYFRARALDPKDENAVCRVARAEIAAGSAVGRLLRVEA